MKDIDVLNHLILDPAITDIVGDKLWTTWLPEQAILPAITCNYVSDNATGTLNGDTLQGREIITVNCWADDKKTAVDLLNAVKLKMKDYAVRQTTQDLSEEEQSIYRYAVDYSVFS